jgi:transcriptional regulator GlxA family with amidase domain
MTSNTQNMTIPPRQIAILGFPDVLLMDVAGPAQVFGSANKLLGRAAYDIRMVTKGGVDFTTDTGLAMRSDGCCEALDKADDLIVPGGPGVDRILDDTPTLSFIARLSGTAQRTISICSGSLLTAAAGLLDSKRATTHWERSALVCQKFAEVDWQLDQIFTQDGKFHCSAGVTAGIDLALSLLEADHGRRVALGVAREMVVFMQRDGGQSQYSRPLKAQSTSSARLSDLYRLIEAEPDANWTIEHMAHVAAVTERTLHRDFMRDMQMPPARYVEERRLAMARLYLERSQKPIKDVARLSGFDTEQKMRRSFVKILKVLPTVYRDRFGELD